MPKDIAAEIKALQNMTTGELAERYEELHGQPVRTRHRAYLIRKIAWRIQANAEGDLTERARRRAAELADDADIRVMAPKTLICPPESGKEGNVRRRLRNGDHDDPRIPSSSSSSSSGSKSSGSSFSSESSVVFSNTDASGSTVSG